jgi:nucleotide-binding universal stress UspA family protein
VGPGEPTPDGVRPPSPALDHLLDEALGERAGEIAARVDEVDFAVAGLLHHVGPGDLLVLGPSGRTLSHGLLRGSITQQCLAQSPCPVAIVHATPSPEPPKHVVIGVDGSPTARRALRWGLAEAAARGVPALVVHVWEVPILARRRPFEPIDTEPHRAAAQALLDTVLAGLDETTDGVDLRPALVEGSAADVLLDHSDAGDLVVVGSRGASGLAGLLLGSTAVRLSQVARNPVVVVPPT